MVVVKRKRRLLLLDFTKNDIFISKYPKIDIFMKSPSIFYARFSKIIVHAIKTNQRLINLDKIAQNLITWLFNPSIFLMVFLMCAYGYTGYAKY